MYKSQRERSNFICYGRYLPLGKFVRKHGRRILDVIEPHEIIKCGKRRYVSFQAVVKHDL